MSPARKILITVDVEDWFQVENLRPWFPPDSWDEYDHRVEYNTNRLLDLFDGDLPPVKVNSSAKSADCSTGGKPVKATFFILGWIADRLPHLVREIDKRGHEVASHGYGHLMCDQLRRSALKDDLLRSKALLEDITGHSVHGYRAPSFSINDDALALIMDCGYRYDSSYNSFSAHGRYGNLSLDRCNKKGIAYIISDDFIEIPISNLRVGDYNLPWGGGGYFRMLPPLIFNAGVRKIMKSSGAYVFYMHPWEIDPAQPRVKRSFWRSGWRHYLNLEKTYGRLVKLIADFEAHDFNICRQYIKGIGTQAGFKK